MEHSAMSHDRPEVYITPWKVHLVGDSAIKAAGWAIHFVLVCRVIGALTPPWLLYLVFRKLVG
jgi:hypothetical protein